MNFRTTLVLLIVAFSLSIWITVKEKRAPIGDSSTSSTGKLLAKFDPNAVTRIIIESGAEDKTLAELHRHAIYWIFDSPITDRASAPTVGAALDQLGHLNILDELRPAELLNSPELTDESLGFGTSDTIRVRLFAGEDSADDPEGDGDKPSETELATIVLGKSAPLANSLYARIEGDSSRAARTYVVSGSPRQYLNDPVAILRDRSLIGVPTEQIVGVTVRTASGEVEVSRRIEPPSTGWNIQRPLQTRADAAMMEEFLARLVGLQITDVTSETAPSSTLPNQIPTGAARIDLQVHGWDRPLSLYVSEKAAAADATDGGPEVNSGNPQAPRLAVQVSTRPGVYELQSSLLTDLPDSAAEFRDPYLARIPAQLLHSITIVSRNDPNVELARELTPQGIGDWYSKRNRKKERANKDRLARMITAINTGKVIDFLSSEPDELDQYGLRSPELRIAFNLLVPKLNADGTVVIAPPSGGSLKTQQRILQFGRTDENTLFANFVGEPWVYQVDPSIRSAIPSHPLKWRDLKVLNFYLNSLSSVERTGGSDSGADKLAFDYDFANDQWQVVADGTPLPATRIDRARTKTFAETLGSLEAVDWITNLRTAYDLLEDPLLEISVTRREIDRLTNEMTNVTVQLKFAKAHLGYYGQIVGSPDVFRIPNETFGNLTAPLLVP